MPRRLNKQFAKKLLSLGLMVPCLVFLLAGLGFGQAQAQDVTQGYLSDEVLQNGLIVRLKTGDKTKVEPLPQDQDTELFGVIVSSSEAPVSLSDPDETQVFVTTRGTYDVLVSNQNGEIRAGDDIVISSIKGVGMKADDLHRVLVGTAIENFAGQADAESRVKISDGRTVSLGRIRVDISIKRNPAFKGDTIAGVPHQLSRIAYAVTDKPVTAFRIYAGLAVMLACIVVAGAVLYSGIHGGMSSVGRNPLAKSAIMRNMIGTTIMSLIVVSVGLFAVYLLLKI